MKKALLLQLNILIIIVLFNGFADCATLKSPISVQSSSTKETGIGSLFADAIRSYTRSDIAIISANEIKVESEYIDAGEINLETLRKYVSFTDDYIVKLNIKGSDIKSALERSVSIYPKPNMGFLQVSGLVFEFDSSKFADSRILSVKVNGEYIDSDKLYTVSMTNSLANGALGYWKFWNIKQLNTKYDKTLIDVIELYINAKSDLDYSSENRITKK
ncbi:MAG: 5'-nucleotidase [Armatimonadota bacterium]